MAMTRGQDSLMMDLGQTQQMVTNQFVANKERVLKVIQASEAELEAHAEYVKNLEKTGAKIW
jgi:DNA polymerase III subunit epsilon